MARIFQILLLFFVIFFLSFLNPKQTNAASTCIYSDCFAIECFPACTASTCNQKVTCVGYCPSKGVYCLTDAGKCDACPTFTCKPKITSCPCSPSQCGGFSACQNDCGSTISTLCGACPTPAPTPTPTPTPTCTPNWTCNTGICNFGCGGTATYFCNDGCGHITSNTCTLPACPTPTPTPTHVHKYGCLGAGSSCAHDDVNGSSTSSTCAGMNCPLPPTPTPTPKPGVTKETQTCSSDGLRWVTTSSDCVSSCVESTPAPTPTPTCNTNPSCGSCAAACSNSNSNVKTCTYTGLPGCISSGSFTCGSQGNPCPSGISGCAQVCPSNFNCVSNSCQPSGSIQGNVFVDANKNRLKDAGEVNYTGSITMSSTGGTITTAAGTYTVSQLLSGSYTVSYTSLPTGYLLTYPIPPSFTVSVGSACSPGSSNSAGCVGGNIVNLNFGITNSNPWIQCVGADCRFEKGFTSKVPSTAADGPYANLRGSGGTPGLIFSGDSSPDFGEGQASSTNWVVGGTVYPETFAPTKVGSVIKTSYAFLLAKTQRGSITPTDISAYCGGSGITSCNLSSSIPNGIYIANGNLTLNNASFTFPVNKNYVILINGNLTINGKIFVPNGSTAAFASSGNIIVDKSVGETSISSTAGDIEGWYSADKSFIVQGTNDCAIGADLRFNLAGNIVVNAALSGGSFQNLRDLCAGNLQYPSFSVKERPDLILNSPEFLKQPNFTYQEIAP